MFGLVENGMQKYESTGDLRRRKALESLSVRERIILQGLAEGKTVSETAATMSLPERLVRSLLTSAVKKLDAKTGMDVVSILLLQAGLGPRAHNH